LAPRDAAHSPTPPIESYHASFLLRRKKREGKREEGADIEGISKVPTESGVREFPAQLAVSSLPSSNQGKKKKKERKKGEERQ